MSESTGRVADATGNWVDGLAPAPKPATFTLPALSVGAIEIPDTGAASALVYGETQHKANLPPQPL